ncbi:lysophospholipase Plb1 [Xylona heveae TC161]|uniref:Lysophospholipase n=1 Tax=Xylona heveae (strain CBS 132557 / TC161) TaxID=1328760 RepID=A0A165JFY1_XYLHT|nr:lysophospholipase Plb1 [Xylona heveae TC161]KZF26182.1 lysophospholipase Plb1 [Xylona heveae TC161]
MIYYGLSLLLTWVFLVVVAQDRQGLEIDTAFAIEAVKRAFPDAPNNYVPAAVNCPSTRPAVRGAKTLSPEEQSWLEKRRNNTIDPMKDLLGRLNITGFDINSWFAAHGTNASTLPNIGLAFSGGGYRALMNGAGAIAAFDSRTNNSTSSGHLGGLLQASTYVAGLSGGSWLVGSIFTNNFTTVTDITSQNTGDFWQFGNSIFKGPPKSGIQLLNTAQYYSNIYDEVSNKEDAGWHISLTDFWGRALSFQLINATDGGPAYTFSSIQDDPQFISGDIPMPIIVADGRAPNQTLISGNSTVYEFTPYEFGTFDPTVFGFVPTRYLGSNFTAGQIPSNDKCIRGFDNAGFVMGVSSTLFNQFLLQINSTSISPSFKKALTKILQDVGEDNNDIADIYPNPFYHYNSLSNPGANATTLTLVDGGEDLQNIPLQPLIQPERSLDVIFAVDSSADTTTYWPNGTSLVATYQRSLNGTGIGNGTAFPYIPDQNTFVNLGLNTRPTFFGCNTSNMTGPGPLIVYLANYPYVFNSNVSTFQDSTNNTERNAVIENGYDVVTMGNATTDAQWPVCVGCAILSRSLERTNTTWPSVCEQCFSKFCWDGTVNSTQPEGYAPPTTFSSLKVNGSAKLKRVGPLALLAALVTGASMM